MITPRIGTGIFLLSLGSLSLISAEPVPTPGATGLLVGKLAEGSAYDQIWSVPTLYKNEGNPVLQELSLVGQLQTQYAYGSDNSGNFGTNDRPDDLTWGDAEVRRFRLGLKGKLFSKLSFLYLTDLNPDLTPRIYKRTPEMYFTYTENDAFNISLGKTELKFNRDQEYSSRDFLPFERSALGNMFYGGELTGAWASGKGIAGGWLYFLGAFSNDRVDEWSHFNGGTMILGKIGYDYTKHTGFDLAEVKFQYLHNSEPGYREDPADLKSPSYSNCISISNQITEGPFDLTTEFLWGDGENGVADVCGLSAMANYSFTKNLQLITTWELAGSSDDNGVFLPTRYEALSPGVGDAKGDAYFAGYAGLNYYIYGQKLKLMSGLKYSYLDGGSGGGDFNGWTWLCGVRMAF
ncbi:MAG: porin [Verrucomicrobiota bacterium]